MVNKIVILCFFVHLSLIIISFASHTKTVNLILDTESFPFSVRSLVALHPIICDTSHQYKTYMMSTVCTVDALVYFFVLIHI